MSANYDARNWKLGLGVFPWLGGRWADLVGRDHMVDDNPRRRLPLQIRPPAVVGNGGSRAVKSGMATTRIRIREDFSAELICPHCGKEIQEIAARRVESILGVRFMYYCCNCRKVLGVSHRKGFWMG